MWRSWFAAKGAADQPSARPAGTRRMKREGSRHFGSHAFDAPGIHARVITAGPGGASFDEVCHRLGEELGAAGLGVVCAASGADGGGASPPPHPPGVSIGGASAFLVAFASAASSPAPVARSVTCHVFEAPPSDAAGPAGAVVVQAASVGGVGSAVDASLVRALDAVFRLPKTAHPPGSYAWPPVKLPPQGGAAAEAAARARAQVAAEGTGKGGR